MFLKDRSTRTLLGIFAATFAVLIGINIIIKPESAAGNSVWLLAVLVIFALAVFLLNWREDYNEAHPRQDREAERAALSARTSAPIGVPHALTVPEPTAIMPQPSMPPAVPLVPDPAPQPVPSPSIPPAPVPTEPTLPEPAEPFVPEPALPPVPEPTPESPAQPAEPAVPPPSADAPPVVIQHSVETQDPRENVLEPTQITDQPASPGPSTIVADPRVHEATPERIQGARDGSGEDAVVVGEAAIAAPQPDPRGAADPQAAAGAPEAQQEAEPVNTPPADNAQAVPNTDSAAPADQVIPIGDGTLPQGFEPLVETDVRPEDNSAPTEAPKIPDAVQRQPIKDSQRDDDLTLVEGIGPYYQKALKQIGYQTFAQVAAANPEDILSGLLAAGFRRHPTINTWPEQAAYAARGDWDGLKAFQSTLVAGRRK